MMSGRSKIWPARRRAVFERDGVACVLCGWKWGDPVGYRKRPPQKRGKVWWRLEIDHIVPLSRGGTHDLDNLRVLCTGCNGSKGAKV